MDLGEIDASTYIRTGAASPGRKQQLVELPVIAIIRERPTQADGAGSFQVSMNGRLTDRAAASDLLLLQAKAESQA